MENIVERYKKRRDARLALKSDGGQGSGKKPKGGGATAGGGSAVKKHTAISYNNAEKMFDAPQGTVIEVTHHSSGDYVGEFTRTAEGWVGSQKYRSSYKIPAQLKTAKGLAMQIVGADIKVK